MELTLQDIQNESLRVLEEFDRFCRAHDLQYSLAYGTLIGAIRHGGFIPWDDDIDVFMPRPQYEKLLETYRDSKDFSLIFPGKAGCTLGYARLCDMSRTEVISKSPWNDRGNGVWIDVFPIDSTPEGEEETRSKYLHCHKMYRRLLGKRRVSRYMHSGRFSDKLKAIPQFLFVGANARDYAIRFDRECGSIPYGSTSRVMDFAAPIGKRIFTYPNSEFDSYIDIQFAGKTFMAVEAYDSVLRAQYGDYMQLPPADQQVRGHVVHKYLWKQ